MTRGRLLAAALLALGAAGCDTDRSVLSPAGPAARRLADLGGPILWGFLAVALTMWALIAWVALRRKGSLEEHAPLETEPRHPWIVIGGFALPSLAFLAIFVATLRALGAFSGDTGRPDLCAPPGWRAPADVRIVGRQWWWDVEMLEGDLADHVRTANEIHVPAGRPVEVELRSADVIHSFWAPRLHGKVDLVPGIVNHIRIQADRPGTYVGACAEFCGLEHALMRLRVIAETVEDHAAWLARERRNAAEPVTDAARRGKEIFLAGACPMCHTIRGTRALGTVGPELTHLASRATLAAGSYPKDLANLHAWVVNAPSLKPGTQMPVLTEFSGPELADVVEYLQSLR